MPKMRTERSRHFTCFFCAIIIVATAALLRQLLMLPGDVFPLAHSLLGKEIQQPTQNAKVAGQNKKAFLGGSLLSPPEEAPAVSQEQQPGNTFFCLGRCQNARNHLLQKRRLQNPARPLKVSKLMSTKFQESFFVTYAH